MAADEFGEVWDVYGWGQSGFAVNMGIDTSEVR
jgi:hypothetical protein